MNDVIDTMRPPCGSIANWDDASGISYRCETCGAVVGSVGMPRACRDEIIKWETWEYLGGQGWDYFSEPEEQIK